MKHKQSERDNKTLSCYCSILELTVYRIHFFHSCISTTKYSANFSCIFMNNEHMQKAIERFVNKLVRLFNSHFHVIYWDSFAVKPLIRSKLVFPSSNTMFWLINMGHHRIDLLCGWKVISSFYMKIFWSFALREFHYVVKLIRNFADQFDVWNLSTSKFSTWWKLFISK